MRKRDELADPKSCMNRARDDEWTFVLLGRDAAAPAAVRAWIAERIRLGKNRPDDPQIVKAGRWIESVLRETDYAALKAEDKEPLPDMARAMLYCLENDKGGAQEDALQWCLDILRRLYRDRIREVVRMEEAMPRRAGGSNP